jgi:hypothetical protein
MQRGKEAELLAILHALELTTNVEILEISTASIHLVPPTMTFSVTSKHITLQRQNV